MQVLCQGFCCIYYFNPKFFTSLNKCMGLLQYIFQEVVAECRSLYNVYEG